jgi:hypothetical protein
VRLPEALAALHEREFRLLFFSRVTSFAGSAIAPVALAFAVLDETDDASALGLVLVARSVPQVVLLLLGGVLADRLPRNVVMVGANALSGVAQLGAGALVLTGSFAIWQLAALAALNGAASAFFFPASQGIVPDTVSAPRLQQANVLLRLGTNAVFIGGPAVGGILVATIGAGPALLFDGFTYLASAVILLAMRLPPKVRTAATTMLHELREGWSEFRTRTWLWVIVLAFGFLNSAHSGARDVLGPLVAKRELGGAEAYGAMVAGTAVGLVLGGLLLLRWRPQRILFVACTAVMMELPLMALLAIPAPLPVLVAAAVAGGIGVEIFGIFWDMALQQNIPRDALSRVYSYDAVGSFVLIPVGLAAAGPAADAFGVDASLLGAAGVIALCGAAMLAVKDVRRIRRVPEDDPRAEPATA